MEMVFTKSSTVIWASSLSMIVVCVMLAVSLCKLHPRLTLSVASLIKVLLRTHYVKLRTKSCQTHWRPLMLLTENPTMPAIWNMYFLLFWYRGGVIDMLTLLPLDKMAAISQMIFSDVFSWMKSLVFWLTFQWSFVQLTITQHWFR